MSVLRSAFDSLSGTLVSLLIGLIGMITLARLVPVEDHGIYALSYAIYLIFQPFLDFGMTPVYLKLEVVNKYVKSVFFIINLYIGLAIALVMVLVSPIMAYLFDNQVLILLILVQAAAVVVMSTSNQPFSQLYREKKFLYAEAIKIISASIALVTAIWLALIGWGIWALVIKFFLSGLLRTIGSWWVVKPKYKFISWSGLKKQWDSILFGGYITGSRLLAGYANNLDKFFVGKVFGEFSLGHYEKALAIVDKPSTLRNALSTPAISHIARMKKSQYASSYHLMVHFLLWIAGVPALFFCSMVRK